MLEIEYSDDFIIAFTIDEVLYYLKYAGNNGPELYNHVPSQLIIPNLDFWVQAQTHQRHSYRSLLDVAAGFRAGMAKAYSRKELAQVLSDMVVTTKLAIFSGALLDQYLANYWVEALKIDGLDKVVDDIRKNFDKLKADDKFYNLLCRLWKRCKHKPDGREFVFEKFIARLGKTTMDPTYPDTTQIDGDLYKIVLTRLNFEEKIPKHILQGAQLIMNSSNNQ